jgi:hypothetical protein
MAGPTGKVQATIEAISSVLPGGRISVSARQDRHRGELGPSWTIHVAGSLAGSAFSLELAGPVLGQVLEDLVDALVTLGFDVPDVPDDPDVSYVPVSGTNPGSYPA